MSKAYFDVVNGHECACRCVDECVRVCLHVCVSLCARDNYDSRVHCRESDTYKHWSGSYPEKLHVVVWTKGTG